MRASGFLPKGTKGVRIEFEKPESEVLLSDFDLWHCVLNYWYIADNKKQRSIFINLLKTENIQFIDKEKYTPELREMVENSWSKIFDMNYDSEYTTVEFRKKQIQATFWNLKSTEITKVDFFNTR